MAAEELNVRAGPKMSAQDPRFLLTELIDALTIAAL